jgi:hypothetical protein
MPDCSQLLMGALRDEHIGWSIGTFGAIGEFVRDADEHCIQPAPSEIVTSRGGIRITPRDAVTVIAYETFVGDSETWGNAVAFCLPVQSDERPRVVRCLGPDDQALRPEDRRAILFDLGVAYGHVSMCVRSSDPELLEALHSASGNALLSPAAGACTQLILKQSPARVLLSPLGRIEVYAPIPQVGGKSPLGPHTHLLPKHIASGRTHSANAPIPAELQPILMMHPPSPWRDSAGQRIPYDPARAVTFDKLVAQYGLEDDQRLKTAVETAIRQDRFPHEFPKPHTRHGRMQLRIILRRLSQDLGASRVKPWRDAF